MRTTLARQLRRRELGNYPDKSLCTAEMTREEEIILITKEWREAHPRREAQKPAKQHRRSRNRRSK